MKIAFGYDIFEENREGVSIFNTMLSDHFEYASLLIRNCKVIVPDDSQNLLATKVQEHDQTDLICLASQK